MITEEEEKIDKMFAAFRKAKSVYDNVKPDKDDLKAIAKTLKYSYSSDELATDSLKVVYDDAVSFVSRPLPDGKTVAALQQQLNAIDTELSVFEKLHPHDEVVKKYVDTVRKQRLTPAKESLAPLQRSDLAAGVAYLTDMTLKIAALLDFVMTWRTQSPPNPSVQVLPIAVYPESKVAVQVKCVDAVTKGALFDAIQFNAYFQEPPQFDISAGFVISTMPSRQVTAQAGAYVDPTATPAPTQTDIIIINRPRPQFIPGAFVEWHPWNFKWPWVHDAALDKSDAPPDPDKMPTWMSDNAPRHPFGYVGSLGLAAGVLVNPNTGSAQAEFFGGVSLGIQRFAILLGEHRGRSQNIANGYGYYEGETVASGTTPPTTNNWANGFALGITYRIPLR